MVVLRKGFIHGGNVVCHACQMDEVMIGKVLAMCLVCVAVTVALYSVVIGGAVVLKPMKPNPDLQTFESRSRALGNAQ